MKINEKNGFKNSYYGSEFDMVHFDNTVNAPKISSTIMTMEDNYKRSISGENYTESKPDVQNAERQNEERPNFDIDYIKAIIDSKGDNGNLVNLLLKNMGMGMSADKVRLISELIKMINKPAENSQRTSKTNNEELNTSQFVKTSDYTLE